MFNHVHWVNRYREKLFHITDPYYKKLFNFLEQNENQQNINNKAEENYSKLQIISNVFANRLREIANTTDEYIKSAIKNFEQLDLENYLRVKEEKEKEYYEKKFLKILDQLKEEERDKLENSDKNLTQKQIDNLINKSSNKLQKKAQKILSTIISKSKEKQNYENPEDDLDHTYIKKGFNIFGKNAQAIRLAKHVMLRIICFELLGTILGEDSPFQTYFFEKINKSVKSNNKKNKQKKALLSEEFSQNFTEDKFDKITININDELTVAVENEFAMEMFRTLGNIFSKAGIGLQDSMIKLASLDPQKIIGLMIKWFFTKQSFSTHFFDGTNAMAVVDSLTAGYLRESMKPSKYKLIKNYFFGIIPQNFKTMNNDTFTKTIIQNAKNFQIKQNVINEAMKDILQAFIRADRLNV